MTVFRVPDLGEGLLEVQIVAWHVGVGDHVVVDQPLVSVETDKAVVEIPSPVAGRVVARFGEPGDVVAVGAPLAEFTGGTTDAGTVVGALPTPSPTPRPALARQPGGEPAAAPRAEVRASPAVRRAAADLGVDLASVPGTGPGGTVTRADLERAAGSRPTTEPLRGVRRSMAANMTRSHAEVAPATLIDDADVHDWPPGTDVTVRLVRAIAVACAAEPSLNAWYLGPDEGRVVHHEVHLGIAVDTADGLFVPVLRNVERTDPEAVRSTLDRLTAAVRARDVSRRDLADATITLSDFGDIGGRYGALVVVPPQVAILGAGRITERVVARAGVPVVRRLLPLSCTFDHRVVTGAEAARFVAAVIHDLGQPT